jgi:hypothetical protein
VLLKIKFFTMGLGGIMDIQFVLTGSAPVFEFATPAGRKA